MCIVQISGTEMELLVQFTESWILLSKGIN